jgi:hypothetical protein
VEILFRQNKKVKKNRRKIFLMLTVVLVSVLCVVFSARIKAGVDSDVSGWMWGGSQDDDENYTGIGWISGNNINSGAGGNVSYGLNIPAEDDPNQKVTGNVWAENIGWISFDESITGTGYPTVGGGDDHPHAPQREVDNITGWARIMSIPQAGANAGGWKGWVRLHSNDVAPPVPYGLKVSSLDGKKDSGDAAWAWSEEFGWIDFSRINWKNVIASVTPNPQLVSSDSTRVSITATIPDPPAGGTAKGNNITYELDCNYENGTFNADESYNETEGTLSHKFNDACTYSTTSTVAVRVTRDGAVTIPTAVVVSGCSEYYCDSTSYGNCSTRLLGSGCSSQLKNECDAACQAPTVSDKHWKEVAP